MYSHDFPFSLSYPLSLPVKFIPFPKKTALNTEDFKNLIWQKYNCLFSAIRFSQGTIKQKMEVNMRQPCRDLILMDQ